MDGCAIQFSWTQLIVWAKLALTGAQLVAEYATLLSH